MSDTFSTSTKIKALQQRIHVQRSRLHNVMQARCHKENESPVMSGNFTPRSRILRALLQGGSIVGPLYALAIGYSTFKKMDYKKVIFALLLKKLIRTS